MKYVTSVGGKWDLWINEATYAYNTSVHSSTGFSPVELMFGRKHRMPLDIMYGIDHSEGLPYNVSEFKEKFKKMYELANENMNTRQSKYLSYYDKKVFDDPIKEEQLVYMYLPRKQHQLALKWFGPCKVITNQQPVYEIQYKSCNRNVGKWIIRDKLRRCEKSTTYSGVS